MTSVDINNPATLKYLGWNDGARFPTSENDRDKNLGVTKELVQALRKHYLQNPNQMMESLIQLDCSLELVRKNPRWTTSLTRLLEIWEETIDLLVKSKRVSGKQLTDMRLSDTDVSNTKLLVKSGRSVHAVFKLMLDMKVLTACTESACAIARSVRTLKKLHEFINDRDQHKKFKSSQQCAKVIQAKKDQAERLNMYMADAEMKQQKEPAFLNYLSAHEKFEELKTTCPEVFELYQASEVELDNTGGSAAGESGRRFEERLHEPTIIRAIMEVLSTTDSAALISGHHKLFTNVTMQKQGKHYGEVDALLVDMMTGQILLWIEQKANSGDLPKANRQREKFMKFAKIQKGAQFTLSSDEKCQGPSQWTDGMCDTASCCRHFQQKEDGSNEKDILRRCIIITQLRTSSAATDDSVRLAIQSHSRMHLYRNLFTLDITDDEQMLYLSKKVSSDLVPASEVVELYRKAEALRSIIVVSQE